jgi:hypothetical protein
MKTTENHPTPQTQQRGLAARIGMGASIRYRVEITEPDAAAPGGARTVQSIPWKKNLILDSGLNQIGSLFGWDDAIRYAVVGDSSEPTRRDSGAVTFTQDGNTLTASAGFFVEADNGRLIKLNDAAGTELRINGYTSPTTVAVDTARAATDPVNGTIWYVNQTGLLGNRVAYTNTYGSDGGDNSVTVQNGEIVRKRTYIFPVATTLQTIREVCWKYSDYTSGDLYYLAFGRDVLAGSGIVLTTGQQLKIVLELHVQIAPATPAPLPPLPWAGADARAQYECLSWNYAFNPAQTGGRYLFLADATDDFHAPEYGGPDVNPTWSINGSATTVKRVEAQASPYLSGSFTRTFTGVFDINNGNMDGITCFGLGWPYYDTTYSHFRVILAAPVSKDNSHILSLPIVLTWGRVLVN